MATRKSTPSAEKKTTTARKAPAKKAAAAVHSTPLVDQPQKFPSTQPKFHPTHEDIARLAERLWNERGRPFGSPEVDWLRAEQTLHAA